MIFLTAKWENMKEKLHFVVGFVKNMTNRDIFPQCGIMRVACPVLPGNRK